MSLILEALKKSEAQRRLGEMPDLGTPITATRRRRRPLPWLAFAVVLALVAAGAWRWLRPTAPPTAATSASEPAKIKAAPGPTMRATPAMTAQQAAPKPASPPATPASPAPPAASPPTAPPPRVSTPTVARTETAATAPAPAAAAPAPRPIVLPPPAPAEAPAPAAVATAPAPPPPVANDVPTVDELPADVRAALPPLPITMQVYSPDPKRRFVIIDGARVVEGESVRGVTVQEIRQAGLVLEFRGHRALLRPGS